MIADGAKRIIICADEPERYRDTSWAPNTQLWHRDRIDEAQRILRDVQGVTVLIYDQQCAADARRQRKRGKLPARTMRVLINEAVCEGCGDCGVKSNCLSVQPVDTELGRKTQIDQTTCNTDYSCLDGNCPSFVTVDLPADGTTPSRPDIPVPPEADEPALPTTGEIFNIFLAGIGGTGVVTVNQVLAMAALRSGLHVEGLDQTGLSQKAGPVTSHLRLSGQPLASSNRVGPQSADCLLAFDLLTAVDAKNLSCATSERTTAVASTSKTPTGDMVYDPSITYPETADLLSRLDVCARSLVAFDAIEAARHLFHDTSAANLLLVGAAYQSGALPISATAIEEAIQINGVAVPINLAAFRWGRVAVADPTAFAAATAKRPSAAAAVPAVVDQLVSKSSVIGETAQLLTRRSADLIAYQAPRTARRLVDLVERTWRAERAVTDRTELTDAVIMYFFKLLAYKDEYEVARQLTDPVFMNSVAEQVPGARNITYRLHPPVLKSLGVKRKIGLGPRSHVALRVLAKGRFLRGHVLDPFGHNAMRRLERRLIDHYETMITELTDRLTADNYATALEAASAPDIVRGYEEVKLANVTRYVDALAALGLPAPDLLPTTPR